MPGGPSQRTALFRTASQSPQMLTSASCSQSETMRRAGRKAGATSATATASHTSPGQAPRDAARTSAFPISQAAPGDQCWRPRSQSFYPTACRRTASSSSKDTAKTEQCGNMSDHYMRLSGKNPATVGTALSRGLAGGFPTAREHSCSSERADWGCRLGQCPDATPHRSTAHPSGPIPVTHSLCWTLSPWRYHGDQAASPWLSEGTHPGTDKHWAMTAQCHMPYTGRGQGHQQEHWEVRAQEVAAWQRSEGVQKRPGTGRGRGSGRRGVQVDGENDRRKMEAMEVVRYSET